MPNLVLIKTVPSKINIPRPRRVKLTEKMKFGVNNINHKNIIKKHKRKKISKSSFIPDI